MKVKVRFSGRNADCPARGAAVAEAEGNSRTSAEHWQHPPRYEVRGEETHEKVVPIRVEPPAPKAEVLPIRPGESPEPEIVTPAELAYALTQLLNPASVLALALAVWSFFADLGMANSFAVTDGAFSHWQTWLAVAGAIQFFNRSLQRRFAPAMAQTAAEASEDSAQ